MTRRFPNEGTPVAVRRLSSCFARGNPKFEYRNSKQIQTSKFKNSKQKAFWILNLRNLKIISYFEFVILNFLLRSRSEALPELKHLSKARKRNPPAGGDSVSSGERKRKSLNPVGAQA